MKIFRVDYTRVAPADWPIPSELSTLQTHIAPACDSTPTLFLDIDQCTFYGQDFNDIVTVFQQIESSESTIKSIIRKLVNPAMTSTIGKLLTSKKQSRVCLYTSKGGIIRGGGFPVSMIDNGEVYIPSSTSLEQCLSESENKNEGMQNNLNRLFKCREVVQEVLDLRCPPELIITTVCKSVTRACSKLLKPPTNPDFAFLWDDNADIASDFHVIRVPEYKALSDQIGTEIVCDLEKVNSKLNTEFKDWLQANKSPCYNHEKNIFRVDYTTEALADWPIPEALAD
jgi:hypothetical protein